MHINVHFIFVRITFKIPPFKIVISPTTRELATESAPVTGPPATAPSAAPPAGAPPAAGSSSTGSRSTAAVELSMLT
jgi:hypothetical protein